MTPLWRLRGVFWLELAKRTCRKSWDGDVFGQSARLAFYFFFALFPMLLLLLILLSAWSGVGGSEGRGALLDSFTQLLPPNALSLIVTTIGQLNARAVLGSGAILAGLYAAWGALNGTWAILTGLNKAYEVEEKRPWWRVLFVMFGLTLVLGVLYLIALAEIVYGEQAGRILAKNLGSPAHFEFFWPIVQWTIVAILLLFSFAVLYRFSPNLRDRRWQWSTPGAAVAVASWVACTLLLREYQEHFSSSRIYGGLNAVATLLMWFYVTGAAILIGGAANSEVEKAATAAGRPDARPGEARRSGGEAVTRS